MLDNNKIVDNVDLVKINLEHEEQRKKIGKQVTESLEKYNKTMLFMTGDAPISILCLPKQIESALSNHGCLRIYDLFNLDFTKVKGLGVSRVRDLTARLDEFVSML